MPSTAALLAVLAGLTFGLSLIVAIGAQNAFVLRQGLLRQHRAEVVTTCSVSDIVLIVLGVGGAGAVLATSATLSSIARIGGAVFLIGYAAVAARRAWRGGALEIDAAGGARRSRLAVLGTTLALTWLNPHVYLDTVLLVGTAANTHGAERWWFAAGTAAGSVIWFSALGFGAAALRPLFARPSAWRALDAGIAAIMLALGISLAVSAV